MESNLKTINEKFKNNSNTVSNLVRNLAFVGVGIVWIMSNQELTGLGNYLTVLTLFCLGLACDVFQYLWRTITLYIIYFKYERLTVRKKIEKGKEILLPEYITYGAWVFFILKVGLILSGFIKICFLLVDII